MPSLAHAVAGVAVAVAAALAGAGCGGEGSGQTRDGAPPDGAQVYADSGCSSCHRLGGPGAAGPGNDLTRIGGSRSTRELRAVLESPPPGMPSYGDRLSSAELDALARYLAAQR